MLADRGTVKQLAGLLAPAVRAVDAVVGEKVAMRVEVELEGEARWRRRVGAARTCQEAGCQEAWVLATQQWAHLLHSPAAAPPSPTDGKVAAGLYVHPRLSEAAGVATAAFARCTLAGQVAPGVWFPEERAALSDRRALLALAARGSTRFLLNRTPWQLETDPVQLGMGFYW